MEKIYRVKLNSKGMPNFSTAVEVADRPQGEWIGCRHEDSEWLSPMADFYKCSMCSKIVNLLQMRSYKYCPNCGARMKGADDAI